MGIVEKLPFGMGKLWQTIGKSGDPERASLLYRERGELGGAALNKSPLEETRSPGASFSWADVLLLAVLFLGKEKFFLSPAGILEKASSHWKWGYVSSCLGLQLMKSGRG